MESGLPGMFPQPTHTFLSGAAGIREVQFSGGVHSGRLDFPSLRMWLLEWSSSWWSFLPCPGQTYEGLKFFPKWSFLLPQVPGQNFPAPRT